MNKSGERGGGGAQNFLGPRGVKYLNTGNVSFHDIHLFLNRLSADIYRRITRYVFSDARYLYKFMKTEKYWVRGVQNVRVIDGKIR
jgi:hypothetical protein